MTTLVKPPANNHRTPAIEAPGTVPDKLAPNSVDSERALLGSLLIDDFHLPEVIALGLTPEDFYIIKNAWIFAAMLDLHHSGQRVNLVTLFDELERHGKLEDVGGPAEFTGLAAVVPTSAHALSYAHIVRDKAIRRRALALAGEMARRCHDETEGFEDNLAAMLEELQDLTATHNGIQTWQLFTLADAYQERPPLTYAVDGLFSLPSLNIVYSGPGMLKSLLLADMLTNAAAGLPWLEPLPGQNVKPFQTISAPVLWVDFDNGQRRTHERFEALARARNLPATLPTLHYTSMPSPWLDVSDKLAVDALVNLIKRNGIKLVVLDNLGIISGGVDENSPAMIPVMSNLRRLAEETGAAIVVIHHQRKGSGTKGRAGETLRGHSCIEAALDLALLIERKEGSDRVSVKSTKTRDVDVLPFSAEWTYEHKEGTTELAQAKFFRVALEKDEKHEELQLIIIACAKTNPGLSQNKLKETVKAKLPEATHHAIRTEILAMAESGQLKAVKSGSGKASAYHPNNDYVDF